GRTWHYATFLTGRHRLRNCGHPRALGPRAGGPWPGFPPLPIRTPPAARRLPAMSSTVAASDPRTPRVHARRLPQPTTAELVRRSLRIATVGARHFSGLAVRQLRHAGTGPLPLPVLAPPLRRTFEDLGGTYM